MWAPADLFTPLLSIFLFPLKRVVSYLYENPMVLALALVGAALLIALATMVGNRRGRRASADPE